jgi:hypothetical protein
LNKEIFSQLGRVGKLARNACPLAPVPPVLSGRDQASPIPSIAISHQPTGADGQEIKYEQGNYMIIFFSSSLESNGQPAAAGIAGSGTSIRRS